MFLFGSRFCLRSACADGLGRESRGVQPLGLLGIFSVVATMRLEKSPNRLGYFPLVGNIRPAPALNSVVFSVSYSAGLDDGWWFEDMMKGGDKLLVVSRIVLHQTLIKTPVKRKSISPVKKKRIVFLFISRVSMMKHWWEYKPLVISIFYPYSSIHQNSEGYTSNNFSLLMV